MLELSLHIKHLNLKTWKENAGYQEIIRVSDKCCCWISCQFPWSLSNSQTFFFYLSLKESSSTPVPSSKARLRLRMSLSTYIPIIFKWARNSAIWCFKPLKALCYVHSHLIRTQTLPRKALLHLLRVEVAKVGRRVRIRSSSLRVK